MNLLSRLFGRLSKPEKAASWPNLPTWSALKDGATHTPDGPRFLWTIPCGELAMTSGRLVACDPFVCLEAKDNPFIVVPTGRFPVFVTLADVSKAQDKSHVREAYASIVFSSAVEAYRKAIPLAKNGTERPEPIGDEFVGFGVDSGTACFVDDSVIGPCMPDPKTWHDDLFDNSTSESWFQRMDDPKAIRAGLANIILPLAKNGENLILFHSGWGDGSYPLVGSFDSAGQLLAVHIDFFIL